MKNLIDCCFSQIRQIVDKEICNACGACVEVCPVDAITMSEKANIDAETCTECRVCVDECPVDAISI